MNRASRINEKLIFITEFWTKLQRCEVEAFDVIYPVDATSILEDIKECLNRIKKQDRFIKKRMGGTEIKYLNIFDLGYLIKEYNLYIKHSVFLKTDLEPYLTNINNKFATNRDFSSFFYTNKINAFNDFALIINDIDHCLIRQKSNLGYFDDMVEIIIQECMNSYPLKEELTLLKGYLTELYIFGIANRYSEEKLKTVFRFLSKDMKPYCNIKNAKYISQQAEEKEYTCIFEVENMFVQSPIKWDDMLIYNPMRVDLLRHIGKEEFLDEDYMLLNLDKQELFLKYELRGNKILWNKNDYETNILQTNSHIRVKIKTDDIQFKIGQIRSDLEEKIQILSISQNTPGFRFILTDKYAYKADTEDLGQVHHIFDRGVRSLSSDRIRKIQEDIKEDIGEPESIINRLNNLSDKENITNALKWYDEARHEKNDNKKFLYYFICIEAILSESTGQERIKDKLIDTLTPILSSRAFSRELKDYFDYYTNQFSALNKKYKGVPSEVKKIDGFERFPVKVDVKKFKAGLPELKKYNDSVYYSMNICEYIKMNNFVKYRRKIVNRYEKKIRFILSRIYGNRNKIVHSGYTNHYQIQMYCTFLAFSANVLLQTIIDDISVSDITEDIGNKLLDTTISNRHSIWFNDFI